MSNSSRYDDGDQPTSAPTRTSIVARVTWEAIVKISLALANSINETPRPDAVYMATDSMGGRAIRLASQESWRGPGIDSGLRVLGEGFCCYLVIAAGEVSGLVWESMTSGAKIEASLLAPGEWLLTLTGPNPVTYRDPDTGQYRESGYLGTFIGALGEGDEVDEAEFFDLAEARAVIKAGTEWCRGKGLSVASLQSFLNSEWMR